MSISEKNQITPSTLYLVATPIGNLADLSERAVKVLSEVDFIAAEDTRNTGHLLSYLHIQKPLVSYHEHNKRERGEDICDRLQAGESCALVTDAGTPAISDPGEDLVALCAERGITVTSIPGCCAGITALTLSGLPTRRFTFEGFLSVNKAERKSHLDSLKGEVRTMILHEAPHKLKTTLADLRVPHFPAALSVPGSFQGPVSVRPECLYRPSAAAAPRRGNPGWVPYNLQHR